MSKCDGCGDENAPSYYIPRGYGGICMCPKCVQLVIHFDFTLDHKEAMTKELKRIMDKVEQERLSREQRIASLEKKTNHNMFDNIR